MIIHVTEHTTRKSNEDITIQAVIITVAVLNIFMTSGSAQWVLIAPISVPILMMSSG